MDQLDRLLDRREPRLHVLEDVTGTLHRALTRTEGRGPGLNLRQTNNSNPQAERRPSVATEPARWSDAFRSSDDIVDKSNTRGLHVPSRITQGARVSRANGQSCFSAREKSEEPRTTKDAPWRATDDEFARAPSGRMIRTPTTHPPCEVGPCREARW